MNGKNTDESPYSIIFDSQLQEKSKELLRYSKQYQEVIHLKFDNEWTKTLYRGYLNRFDNFCPTVFFLHKKSFVLHIYPSLRMEELNKKDNQREL